MDTTISAVLAFLAGGALGGLLVRLARARAEREAAARAAEEAAGLRARLEERTAHAARLDEALAERGRAVEAFREEAAAARESLAKLAAELEGERRSAAEKLAVVGRAEAALRDAFRSLSAEALRSNNESFLQLAKESLERFQTSARDDLAGRQKSIGDLVTPVQEALRQVEEKLRGIEKERAGAYEALREQVRSLGDTQKELRTETAGLVRALRAPQVRGRWGEIQLRRVVEMAGMLDHCDFVEQKSAATEDGRLRPDLVVRLPGGKHVVVDAKAPLAAYLESLEAVDDAAREARLKDHARQVRDHMARLGGKSYWDQFRPAPEFVVMFLPGETFFQAALQHDPGLIEFGVDRFVIPASPTTLIALLRSAFYGWQQERIAESAQEIRDLGADLYDRLRVMAGHLTGLGSHLDKAVRAFDEVAGSFERRVLVAARRFRELGSATARDIPEVEPVGRSTRSLEAAPEEGGPGAGL